MFWLTVIPPSLASFYPIWIWIGAILQKSSASFLISIGQVALYMSVYLSGCVTQLIIFLISFSNPMSSILSASSNTKYVVLLKFVSLVLIKSISLPGVAIKISTPSLSFLCCSYFETPPKIASVLIWQI